jgi:hypothetical protein
MYQMAQIANDDDGNDDTNRNIVFSIDTLRMAELRGHEHAAGEHHDASARLALGRFFYDA